MFANRIVDKRGTGKSVGKNERTEKMKKNREEEGRGHDTRGGKTRAAKRKGRRREEERGRRSRDPKWSSERSTHLQAKVEIGALDALDAQARDVLLAIGAVVFRIQI